MGFFKSTIAAIVWSVAATGCMKTNQVSREPDSVADAREVFKTVRQESKRAISLTEKCNAMRKNGTQGWAMACIESNDQRMKLSLMESEYANAGVRLSGWGISLLQNPKPDSSRANELQLFLDDVEYFKDKAEDMSRSQFLPRCLASVYSKYGSLIPPNCCDFYQSNLPDTISTRLCNVDMNKIVK